MKTIENEKDSQVYSQKEPQDIDCAQPLDSFVSAGSTGDEVLLSVGQQGRNNKISSEEKKNGSSDQYDTPPILVNGYNDFASKVYMNIRYPASARENNVHYN